MGLLKSCTTYDLRSVLQYVLMFKKHFKNVYYYMWSLSSFANYDNLLNVWPFPIFAKMWTEIKIHNKANGMPDVILLSYFSEIFALQFSKLPASLSVEMNLYVLQKSFRHFYWTAFHLACWLADWHRLLFPEHSW